MMAAVIDLLARLKERGEFTDDDDLVFGCEGDYLHPDRLRKRDNKAIERAGCGACDSMTCAMHSDRRRSPSSIPTPCRARWATSTTQRRLKAAAREGLRVRVPPRASL
jgi:hypothetical protein